MAPIGRGGLGDAALQVAGEFGCIIGAAIAGSKRRSARYAIAHHHMYVCLVRRGEVMGTDVRELRLCLDFGEI